jgi:3-hydroxyisobutyrate dehydrogenase
VASHEPVAVLGAGGTMGFAIARNIARAGIELRAWNRTREKAERLTEDGASIFDSPAEAAERAAVVLTMLADGDAVVESMDGERGALSAVTDSTVWLQMSTIGARAWDQAARGAGPADRDGLRPSGPA